MQLMKKSNNKDDLIYSDICGEEIPFTVGDSSIIISILRDKIYSNPKVTMIQEYMSNAKDACAEAGIAATAIEVHLPDAADPTFSVRDYGPGMDDTRVREVFVQYGKSTKRRSVSQLGCFGIGAKIAWAYTDSFTIECFHNGTHTTYIADTGTNKEGRLLVANTCETKEANGVKISIPIKDRDYSDIIESYVRTVWLWEHRPKTNMDAMLKFPVMKLQLPNTILWSDLGSRIRSGFYLDAAGIPYRHDLTYEETNKLPSANHLAITVRTEPLKMGIAANREEFSNKDYAKTLFTRAVKEIDQYVKKKVEAAGPENLIDLWDELQGNHLYKYLQAHLSKNSWYWPDQYYGNTLKLNPDKGIAFLTIEPGRGVVKSLEKRSVEWKGSQFYSSTYTDPVVDYSVVTTATKNAIAQARAAAKNGAREVTVVFQHKATPEDYAEICKVLKVTQALESVYNAKPTRTQNGPRAPRGSKAALSPKDFHVHRYRAGRIYDTVVRNDPMDLEVCLKDYPVICYSENGSPSVHRKVEAINTICPTHKVAYVWGGKNTIAYLAKQPYAFPEDKLMEWIQKTPEVMQCINTYREVQSDRDICSLMAQNPTALKFQNYDLEKIFVGYTPNYAHADLSQLLRDLGINATPTRFDGILKDFPLLSNIDIHYRMEDADKKALLEELQIYIRAKEATQVTLAPAPAIQIPEDQPQDAKDNQCLSPSTSCPDPLQLS